MILRGLCVVLAAAFGLGCTSAEAREDEAVLRAIDVLRDSPSEDLANRHRLVDALAKLPASSPLAREARDACAETYRLRTEGMEETLKVKADLDRSVVPKNSMQILDAAEEKLKKSEVSMKACQKAAIELSMKRRS